MKKYFENQINNGKPCNGDFLMGKTIQEFIKEHINSSRFAFDENDDIESRIESKVKEWNEHKGQYRLFWFDTTDSTTDSGIFTVKSAWSEELEFLNDYEFESDRNGLPSFKKKR